MPTFTNESPSEVNSAEEKPAIFMQTPAALSPIDKEHQRIYASSSSNKSVPGTLFFRFTPIATKSSLAIQQTVLAPQRQEVTTLQGPPPPPPPPPAGQQPLQQRGGPPPGVAQMMPYQQLKMQQVQNRQHPQDIYTYYQNPKTSENVVIGRSKTVTASQTLINGQANHFKTENIRRTSKKMRLSRQTSIKSKKYSEQKSSKRSRKSKSSRRSSKRKLSERTKRKISSKTKMFKINGIMLTGLFYTSNGELPLLQITVGVILGAIVIAELGANSQIFKQRQSDRIVIPRETQVLDNFEESVRSLAAHSTTRFEGNEGDDEFDEQEDKQDGEQDGENDI
ncbi:hypothetical protein BDK51DRAFT_26856 [Blyttiomyces helicus]|uniref:Uncharacterized protein n=1 Tax=Blyttiomyces helicus TaxID=388810 RepID=A0A4P9WN80_9FUNG|nr:hypothetical protein BDK51DRAFT_26856 [Blyttiomyces helicus]|eukprot:RKO94571.1 hypothetical protein BDK51DRAFT_26856 [Blyttiomyces helicus]